MTPGIVLPSNRQLAAWSHMVEYTQNLDAIRPEHLHGFFAGWPNPPSPETHLRILQQSSHVVLAFEPSGKVVGFITAISDGVLSAYVPLLEVLPPHRGRGIGTALVRRFPDWTFFLTFFRLPFFTPSFLRSPTSWRPASSCRRSSWRGPCGSARSCASSGPGRAARAGAGARGSSRCPSAS